MLHSWRTYDQKKLTPDGKKILSAKRNIEYSVVYVDGSSVSMQTDARNCHHVTEMTSQCHRTLDMYNLYPDTIVVNCR